MRDCALRAGFFLLNAAGPSVPWPSTTAVQAHLTSPATMFSGDGGYFCSCSPKHLSHCFQCCRERGRSDRGPVSPPPGAGTAFGLLLRLLSLGWIPLVSLHLFLSGNTWAVYRLRYVSHQDSCSGCLSLRSIYPHTHPPHTHAYTPLKL